MADMKYTKGKIDIGHIQPIKLAYEFGKDCLQKLDSTMVKYYDERFRDRYIQLIGNRNNIRNIFTKRFADVEFPLAIKNQKFEENLKRLNSATKNPIIYESKPKHRTLSERERLVLFYLVNQNLFSESFISKLKEASNVLNNKKTMSNQEFDKLLTYIEIEGSRQLYNNTIMNNNESGNNSNNINISSILKKKTRKYRKI
jgi:hypothetical protein